MNFPKKHIFPAWLCQTIQRMRAMLEVKRYCQTADGFMLIVEDKVKKETYRVDITPIRSEATVIPDSVDELIRKGGF